MKKRTTEGLVAGENDLEAEYDFRGGVRGKHYNRLRSGYTVKIHRSDGTTTVQHIPGEKPITLATDVRAYFPDSKAVNRALRSLIALIPEKRKEDAKRAQR